MVFLIHPKWFHKILSLDLHYQGFIFGMFFDGQITSSSDIEMSDLADCSSVRRDIRIELKK